MRTGWAATVAGAVAVVAAVLGGVDTPHVGVGAPDPAVGAPAGDSSLLARSGQHVVVVAAVPGASRSVVVAMERTPEGWRRAAPPKPAVVGRAGVGPKREGDGRSPRGVFPLGEAFGYAHRPPAGLRLPYRAMAPGAVCVDDPGSTHYARIVDPDTLPGEPDWSSAEPMRRDLARRDGLYRLGVRVRYNPEGEPGAGSCIFLHVWRGPGSPTVGCTALEGDDLLALMRWLDPARDPVLVQGTPADLEALRARGALPYPPPKPEADRT